MLCFFVVYRVFPYEFSLFILTRTLGGNTYYPHFPDQDTEAQRAERTQASHRDLGKRARNLLGSVSYQLLEPRPSGDDVSFYEVNKNPPAFLFPGLSLVSFFSEVHVCCVRWLHVDTIQFWGFKVVLADQYPRQEDSSLYNLYIVPLTFHYFSHNWKMTVHCWSSLSPRVSKYFLDFYLLANPLLRWRLHIAR